MPSSFSFLFVSTLSNSWRSDCCNENGALLFVYVTSHGPRQKGEEEEEENFVILILLKCTQHSSLQGEPSRPATGPWCLVIFGLLSPWRLAVITFFDTFLLFQRRRLWRLVLLLLDGRAGDADIDHVVPILSRWLCRRRCRPSIVLPHPLHCATFSVGTSRRFYFSPRYAMTHDQQQQWTGV